MGRHDRLAGSDLELDLTLCGESHRDVGALLDGLASLGDRAIGEDRHTGPEHGTFRIAQVETLAPHGSLPLVAGDRGQAEVAIAPWAFPNDFLPPNGTGERAGFSLELRSPTLLDERSERLGAAPGPWSFATLIRSLARRVSLLSMCYGERHLLGRDRSRELEEAAGEIVEVDRCCALLHVPRYSSRHERSMEFAGYTGWVRFAGSPQPWLPLLRAAELLHVGRHCVFGWGEVRVR